MSNVGDPTLVLLRSRDTALASNRRGLSVDSALSLGVARSSTLAVGASQTGELRGVGGGRSGVAVVLLRVRVAVVLLCVCIAVVLLCSRAGVRVAVVLLGGGSSSGVVVGCLLRVGVGVALSCGTLCLRTGGLGVLLLLGSGLEMSGVVCHKVFGTDFDGEGDVASIDSGGCFGL